MLAKPRVPSIGSTIQVRRRGPGAGRQRRRLFLGTKRVAGKGPVQVLEDHFLRVPVGGGADVDARIGDRLERGIGVANDFAARRAAVRGFL